MRRNEILHTTSGSPLPFGATFQGDGINFSVYSKNATALTLALFRHEDPNPIAKIPLDPLTNRTGDIWHIFVHPLKSGLHYAFFVDGPNCKKDGFAFNPEIPLIDPYAKLLSTSNEWGKKDTYVRGVLEDPEPFDWQGDRAPRIPLDDMIVYEMHVRGFTKAPSSGVTNPGTFLGIIEKIPYLKSLGVNAIEMLPVHAFNECEYVKTNPETGKSLYNYWGYSTINFFAPMNRYASDNAETLNEFRQMVTALHKEGIEVILDVVFNHTAEGNEKGPTISFRGFENSVYYMINPDGEYLNFSGCGNTFNCNHPVVRELIRNSLRYWVSEMHVDGFRFDLASILGRAADGCPLPNAPLLEMIALDPILGNIKLIAEAWDAGGLYQVGSFPSWGVWAEWNGKYRDDVRAFIKGSDNMTGAFATRLCGSPDLYSMSRTPGHSINFITCHDGFSLKDLVSYNEKHNLANDEQNRDGCNDNASWNCGAEGDTQDEKVIALRKRQLRNFIVALFVSQGVPMLCMGDEIAQGKGGNNNTWCHDNELNWLPWDSQDKEMLEFVSQIIHFRKNNALLRQKYFLTNEEIAWHGWEPNHPDWSPGSRFLAFTLFDKVKNNDLYIAFNAHYYDAPIQLPALPAGKHWHLLVDTNQGFTKEEDAKSIPDLRYNMASHSSVILKAL